MAYVEWGDPANPRVLVCVHGLTRCGRDFDFLAEAMAGEYRVICPDIVGRGRSDWLRNKSLYAIPQYCADIATLLAKVGAESVDWVGTSMGGLIGMALAIQPETPIRRLVLNDVGPVITAVMRWSALACTSGAHRVSTASSRSSLRCVSCRSPLAH
jgi:pimeloyl-ACP methyl ester carboxylesterase